MPSARIVSRQFRNRGYVLKAKKAREKRAKCKRNVVRPRKNRNSGEPKLKILRWLEADLLRMYETLRREMMPGQFTEKCIHPEGPGESRQERYPEGIVAIDAEHPKGSGIIADRHRATHSRTPPEALLAKRKIQAQRISGYVGVKETKLIRCGHRRGGGYWYVAVSYTHLGLNAARWGALIGDTSS